MKGNAVPSEIRIVISVTFFKRRARNTYAINSRRICEFTKEGSANLMAQHKIYLHNVVHILKTHTEVKCPLRGLSQR